MEIELARVVFPVIHCTTPPQRPLIIFHAVLKYTHLKHNLPKKSYNSLLKVIFTFFLDFLIETRCMLKSHIAYQDWICYKLPRPTLNLALISTYVRKVNSICMYDSYFHYSLWYNTLQNNLISHNLLRK